MSSIGQKIKDALTGHHEHEKSDVKTPDVNAPGAFPTDEPATKHHDEHNKLTKESPVQHHQEKSDDVERGALHHTGHSHHDPEPETKQATSAAGNYPYWGDLPREGGEHVHRAEGPGIGATEQHHGLNKDSSLATGALAAGAGTAGAGYLASRSKDEDPTTYGGTRAGATRDPTLDNQGSNTDKNAGAAGVAGATYLATRDKTDPNNRSETEPTHRASKFSEQTQTGNTIQNTQTPTTTQKAAETATPTKTTSAGDNNSHRREEEALAAGAGAAGLAGAGYYASQKGDKTFDSTNDPAFQTTQGSHTQNPSHTTTSTGRHDPLTETQKATSAAGNYPYLSSENRDVKDNKFAETTTPSQVASSGDNYRKEQALAAGAGASGLAGAGYLASRKHDDRKDETTSRTNVPGVQTTSTEHQAHTTNPTRHHDPEDEAKRATSGAGNYPHWGSDEKGNNDNKGLYAAGLGGAGLAGAGALASNRADRHRDELPNTTCETSAGVAAPGSLAQRDTTSRQADPTTSGGIHNTVVGAGSSEFSPPLSSSTTSATGYQTQGLGQHSQPAAQAAAQQAWNKQESVPSTTTEDVGRNNKHSDLGYAAAGTAFGAGATGLAAEYGQGREHENNPRTETSEKVAHRALGSDGKPHAPASSEGSGFGHDKSTSSGLTSGLAGSAGQSGANWGGSGSKVLHKCDNCGHDNDISRYFNKDATFRSQQ